MTETITPIAKKLRGNSVRQAGYGGDGNQRWQVVLEEGMSFFDAQQPTFWSHNAEAIMGHDKLKPHGLGDIIEVRSFDKSAYVELYVVEVGAGYIKTKIIQKVEDDVIELPEDIPMQAKWNLGRRCYDVVRTADKVVVSGGHQTKAKAVAWIASHLKAMAA